MGVNLIQKLEVSKELIKECIMDLYLDPRNSVRKWSKITNQTCQIRMAYPGQHLASVITGIKGTGTAARGDDLSDGTEVKTCSRADQLSECRSCGSKVLVWEKECSVCNSNDINIKTDSHWIFTIPTEEELDLLLNRVPRLILILFDKESVEVDDIRLRAWEVSTKESYVRDFFGDYFYNNYLLKTGKGQTPAPCNLHPLKYDFFLMNPKLIFHSEIFIEDKNVEIVFWDIENPKLEPIPTDILQKKELVEIFGPRVKKLSRGEIAERFPYIPEEKRSELKMRKKVLKTYKEKYRRR